MPGPYRTKSGETIRSTAGILTLLGLARTYRAGGPGPKATLLALVERMGQTDGEWSCWPSLAVIAHDSEQGQSTVRRHIADFERDGLVERRHQGRDGGGRGPNLLVLNVDVLEANRSDRAVDLTGANRSTKGGKPLDLTGANRSSEDSSLLIERFTSNGVERSSSPPATGSALVVPEPFDDFWNIYPRRTGKRTAEVAWANARKRAPAEAIIEGAMRLRDDPNREDAYTPHPTTWLNRDGWEDDPLPARSSSRQSRLEESSAAILATEGMYPDRAQPRGESLNGLAPANSLHR